MITNCQVSSLWWPAAKKSQRPSIWNFVNRTRHGTKAPKQRVIDLEGFNPAGTDAYFNELTHILQTRGYAEEAEIIAGIDEEQRAALHQLTSGSPIALAIALQIIDRWGQQ